MFMCDKNYLINLQIKTTDCIVTDEIMILKYDRGKNAETILITVTKYKYLAIQQLHFRLS